MVEKELIATILEFSRRHYIDLYDAGERRGLCYSLQYGLYHFARIAVPASMLCKLIPEVNPAYFNSEVDAAGYWWHVEDKESRLKAFDKLINLYKNEID